MKFLQSLLSLMITALSIVVYAKENPNRIEKYYDPVIQVVHYLPTTPFGICEKGKNAEFSLIIASQKAGNIQVKYDVIDYYGKKCSSGQINKTMEAPGRIQFKFQVPSPGKYGHFTLDSEIFLNEKRTTRTQSAFVVLPPAIPKADPYFELDGRNPHYNFNFLPAYKRIGVGTIALTSYENIKNPDIFIRTYFEKPREYKNENVVGYISLPGPGFNLKKMRTRVEKKLYPFTDEDYAAFEKGVRAILKCANGRIKFWSVIQEVDGWMTRSDVNPTAVMTDHIIRVKLFSKAVRELAPDSMLAIMNSCGDDFFNNDFRVTRMLLKETAKYVDRFSIDGYSGTWNGVISPLEGPELNDRFKTLMYACIKTSAEFGLKREVYQAERGYYVPYYDALNSPKCHDLANLNTRSIIIARSIPGIKRYSVHGGCMIYLPYQIRQYIKQNKTTPEYRSDYGLWRCVYNADNQLAVQPRPGLCAYATVTRMLAFVSDAKEQRITKDIHSCHFSRSDGKRVIAIWTTAGNVNTILNLPQEAYLTDLMGNTQKLAPGKQRMVISQAPNFIVVDLNADKTSAMLKTLIFPDIKKFNAFARTIGPDKYLIHLVSFSNHDMELKITPKNGQKVPQKTLVKANASIKIPVEGKPGKVELSAGGDTLILQVPYDMAIPVKYGTQPGKITTIQYPQHVRPYSALRSEQHFFREDGTDIMADFSASWDEQFLYLDFKVRDRTHLQRQQGSSIWKDDSIQFAIDAENNALPKAIAPQRSFGSSIHLFGLALTKSGPYCHAWLNGKRPGGSRDYKTSIIHKNNMTYYRTAIPWKGLAPLKPVKGTSFGFSFLVWDNNQHSFRVAPYCLSWTEGIANSQDASKFKTLILE